MGTLADSHIKHGKGVSRMSVEVQRRANEFWLARLERAERKDRMWAK